MGKIPCKLCAACGLYHGVAAERCECGADLSRVPALLVDTPIPPERYGELDESRPVYVQKCSACGAENFIADPAKPVRVCYNCHKARVASVAPVLYQSEEKKAPPEEPEPAAERGKAVFQPPVLTSELVPEEPEEDGSSRWQGILGNIQETVGGGAPSAAGRDPAPSASGPAAPPPMDEDGDDDGDEDGGDLGGWGRLLGVTPSTKPGPASPPAPVRGQELTLTALRYGSLTITLKAGQKGLPCLLGRSAECWQFLSQDIRVSNEHCYLDYRAGGWVVIDNHSANGTAVNGRFLELNGQSPLRDGDELMLGHHADSMAFRVTIR